MYAKHPEKEYISKKFTAIHFAMFSKFVPDITSTQSVTRNKLYRNKMAVYFNNFKVW